MTDQEIAKEFSAALHVVAEIMNKADTNQLTCMFNISKNAKGKFVVGATITKTIKEIKP